MSNESSSATHPITEAIQTTSSEQVGHKVFAGNLAFATKDADLSEAFSKFGKVSDAQVIHRGTRSLGYGFVTFENENEATAAVSSMDKADLQGRPINVEMAKPSTSSAGGRVFKEAAQAAAKKNTTNGAEAGEVAEGGEQKPAKARKPRAKKARRPRADAETEEAGDAPLESTQDAAANGSTAEDGTSEKPKRAPRQRKPKKSAAATGTGTGEEAAAASGEQAEGGDAAATSTPAKPRTARPARKGPPTGEPSQTLVFVSNLSFTTTDESLAAAFSDYGVEYARVVTRKYGPAQGKSKGFAFVDFKSHQDQTKALEQAQGKEVDGRNITLKVAIQEEPKTTEDKAPTSEADKIDEQPKA